MPNKAEESGQTQVNRDIVDKQRQGYFKRQPDPALSINVRERGDRIEEGKYGNNPEATQDDHYTQEERGILIAGTARSADLVSALDQEEVQDDFVPNVKDET